MEKIEIEDFLSIKKANIELKKINILIGPQATGKSIISKLISFCKEIPGSIFDATTEEKTKREFDRDIREKFENIFPSYAWEKDTFLIYYTSDYYELLIRHEKINQKFKLCIEYSDDIKKTLASSRKILQKSLSEDPEAKVTSPRMRASVNREIRETISASLLPETEDPKIEQVIYIPAGRSFFANLQKNVFSFISSSIPIDHFLKEFGAVYERTRDQNFQQFMNQHRPKSVSKLVSDLICGVHLTEKGQDWIVGENGKINLSNSSSGQQEVLPMAMVLSTWPYAPSSIFIRSFIIEEPEAHLFPIAQGQIASLIAAAYNAKDRQGSFTITTHSPYILTAINNLIQAGNVATMINGKKDKLFNIVPENQIISFEDVSAYLVDKGVVKPILDKEVSLIQAEAIDSVSEYFSTKFEQLIELEMEQHAKNGDLV
jgi:predicted ATPase